MWFVQHMQQQREMYENEEMIVAVNAIYAIAIVSFLFISDPIN